MKAARVVKRKLYVINVPPRLPVEKIYDKIASVIRTGYAEIRVANGKAYIEIVGTTAQLKENWQRIKDAVKELWDLYSLEIRGEAPVDIIAREAGATFPPQALVEALRLLGYEARLIDTGETKLVQTNAPSRLVIKTAGRLGGVMETLRFRVAGSVAKRVIAAVAVGLNVDPETVIEYGLRMRVFERGDDSRIRLRGEASWAVRKLAVVLKGAQVSGSAEGTRHGGRDKTVEEE